MTAQTTVETGLRTDTGGDPATTGPQSTTGPVAYVLKMYPRFSETFIVSEILAREAAGEEIIIFSLRPPNDPRFHPELARVKAPVIQVPRPSSARTAWASFQAALSDPALREGAAQHLEALGRSGHDVAQQSLEVARMARERGVSHLHAHFASVSTEVARLAGLISGMPYSFTAHAKDIFHQDVKASDLRERLADAHHAITISQYNLDHLRREFGEDTCARLHLVRNGLELDRFAHRPHARRGTGPARIVSVGRLVEKKGFGMLLETVAALREQGRDIELDIVGEGALREELIETIERLGLTGHARLLGPRTQSEVTAMLREADLFVGSFLVGRDANVDGLPTVLLEAMAVGVLCVATDVTAVGEVVRDGDTGVLVPAGDVPALAAGIGRALDLEDEERSAMLSRARALIEAEYDSDRQARALQDLVTGGAR